MKCLLQKSDNVEPGMDKARLALLGGINEELATHSRNEQAVI